MAVAVKKMWYKFTFTRLHGVTFHKITILPFSIFTVKPLQNQCKPHDCYYMPQKKITQQMPPEIGNNSSTVCLFKYFMCYHARHFYALIFVFILNWMCKVLHLSLQVNSSEQASRPLLYICSTLHTLVS